MILVATSIAATCWAACSARCAADPAEAATAAVGVPGWGVRVANATGTVAGLATDAAINAGVQVDERREHGDGFVDNLLANAAVRVALAPLQKAVAAWGGGARPRDLGVWERTSCAQDRPQAGTCSRPR